jgi:hypothetical protein
MAVKDVEKDIEHAIEACINARLATDGVAGVSSNTLLTGAPGEEPNYPYIFVMCRPLAHRGAGTDQWTGDASVEIMTKHQTPKDRDATTMAQILGSVAYALDYDNFSTHTQRISSLALRRTGGSYTFEGSTNICSIDIEIIKACGQK